QRPLSDNGSSGWSNICSNSASSTLTAHSLHDALPIFTSFTDDTGQTVMQTSAVTPKVVDVPPTMAVPTVVDSTNAGAFREGDALAAYTTRTNDDRGPGANGNIAIK